MSTADSSTTLVKSYSVSHMRLVWALASKDIVDALKTKTTLTTIIITLLMVAFYRYFPSLTAEGDTLRVFLYSASESALVTELERSPALAVDLVDSRNRLLEVIAGTQSEELALVIPGSAAAQLAAGEPVTIEGYTMYWLSPAKRAEMKALVEDELSSQLGQPVTVDFSGHDVDFSADTKFFDFSATFALLFVTLMIGISLVPNLMVEEKMAKTLDALMVSPAGPVHLVAGKTLAGLFYGLTGSVIVFIVFRHLIVRWEIAILAAVLGTLFMTAIGLLLGSYVKVRAQLQLVAWFIIIPLLIPVFLVEMEGLVPTGIVSVIRWIPTVQLARLFRLSMTPDASLTHYGTPVLVILGTTMALLALVAWIIRREDRR